MTERQVANFTTEDSTLRPSLGWLCTACTTETEKLRNMFVLVKGKARTRDNKQIISRHSFKNYL